MKTALKFIVSLLFFFVFAPSVSAHQPYYVDKSQKIDVVDPEISKAYYGEMVGKPAFYVIDAKTPFKFYLNILVPKIPNINKDYIMEIYRGKSFVKRIDSRKFEWKEFYEKIGGDTYYEGPEYSFDADAGLYSIILTSKDNFGKYVIAVGETETFDSKAIFHAIKEVPVIKKDFFEYSWPELLFDHVGYFHDVPALVLLVVVLILVAIFTRRKIKDSRKTKK